MSLTSHLFAVLKSVKTNGELARYTATPIIFILYLFLGSALTLRAAESWTEALAEMPLESNVRQLNRTNCVETMLRSFQSNQVVKGLIFMPGATDEFYMFRRARADLTNSDPSLLDAVAALTNQTLIRATFRPPLLLLHTDEDPLEPLVTIGDAALADKLKQIRFVPHGIYNDRDWDFLQPILAKKLKLDLHPLRYTYDSWHFYRHSFACWDLSGWEALEATALAGKTKFSIERNHFLALHRTRVLFECDTRVRATPVVREFPR